MYLAHKWASIAFIALFWASAANTPEAHTLSTKNYIYNQIVSNSPNIHKGYALKLSHVIREVASDYNIDPIEYTAILAQESMYKVDSINYESKDYGIAQINHRTIAAYGFDTDRLTYDLEYSVEAGAIVLSDLKRSYGHRENSYWTRYNSSKPEKRKIYHKLVTRYM